MRGASEGLSLPSAVAEYIWFGVGSGDPWAIALFACIGWLCFEVGRWITAWLT